MPVEDYALAAFLLCLTVPAKTGFNSQYLRSKMYPPREDFQTQQLLHLFLEHQREWQMIQPLFSEMSHELSSPLLPNILMCGAKVVYKSIAILDKYSGAHLNKYYFWIKAWFH